MALQSLRISNFITIDHLDLDCFSGLSVFTGESGSGKSVLFEALYAVLGKSGSNSLVGPFKETATIEAVFNVFEHQNSLINQFTDNGSDPLIIYREFNKNKAAVIKINSQTVTLKILKEVSAELVITSDQHEQIQLTKADYQLHLLDRFAKNELLLKKYKTQFQAYQDSQKALQELLSSNDKSQQELDFIDFQINDIAQHNFKENEDIDLEEKKLLYKSSKKESTSLQQAVRSLQHSISEQQLCLKALSQLQGYSEEHSVLEAVLSNSEELNFSLSKRLQTAENYGDQNIDDIESRLDLIFQYKTKYRCNRLTDLVILEQQLKSKKETLVHADSLLKELTDKEFSMREALHKLAIELRETRKTSSKSLVEKLIKSMKELEFNTVDFSIEFNETPTYLSNGADKIDFLLSVNKGQQKQALAKVSSGGELSRILLAFYALFSESVSQDLLLFDEIDSGIGGFTGHAVADYLKKISLNKQVFCITHLAQIAQKADHHVCIRKDFDEHKSFSTAVLLNKAESQQELTRMLGGQRLIQEIL